MMNTTALFSGQWLPSRHHPISARDEHGGDHFLVVIRHPHNLISISDSEMIRIFPPAEAIRLIRQLADALGVPAAGSLSSRF